MQRGAMLTCARPMRPRSALGIPSGKSFCRPSSRRTGCLADRGRWRRRHVYGAFPGAAPRESHACSVAHRRRPLRVFGHSNTPLGSRGSPSSAFRAQVEGRAPTSSLGHYDGATATRGRQQAARGKLGSWPLRSSPPPTLTSRPDVLRFSVVFSTWTDHSAGL